MNTVVTNLKLMNGSGALKAFLDVTFDEHLTIKGFRVVQKEGQEPWVAFPQITYEKDGKTVRKDVLEVSRLMKKEITEKVLEEFAKQTGKEPF